MLSSGCQHSSVGLGCRWLELSVDGNQKDHVPGCTVVPVSTGQVPCRPGIMEVMVVSLMSLGVSTFLGDKLSLVGLWCRVLYTGSALGCRKKPGAIIEYF